MKTMHFLAIILPVTLAVGGCAASDGGSGATGGAAAAAAAPLVATGGFTAEIDKSSFTVDYTGLTAKAVMQHRINKTAGGLACVPTAVIEVAQADGTCKLQLKFEAGFAGEGLLLKTASFTAKAGIYQDKTLIQTLPCKGWTTEPAKGEVIYASAVAEGTLILPPLSQPEAGMAKATLKNKALAMVSKPTTMVFQGRKFTVDLSKISFKGDITSEGSDSVQCVKTFHEFPQWELMDINPGSKGFNTKYGLDAFKGKKVVVALVSDWCGSCLSQTKMMQDLQDKATAAGKDAVMIVINDKQKSKPEALTSKAKDIPIFQDEGGVDAWNKMNKGHEGKFSGSGIRNSGYGFAKNGEPIMYFEPNGVGSLNLTDFEKAVQTVLNAPDEK